MRVKNRLLDTRFVIYQDDEWFKFSLDSVLLANFVNLNLRTRKIIDLATGNAPIPILLSMRTNASIYGVEFQKCIYELGFDSVRENNLLGQITLIHDDVKNLKVHFNSDSFDVVTCNPPYFKVHNLLYVNDNSVKSLARHEITLTIDDVLKTTSYLLRNGGIFAMVHRTERFIEIIEKMRMYHIEPKRIQFIYPKKGKSSDLFLIEGIKNGKAGVTFLSPLVVHEDNDCYTDEVAKILDFND